jgi:hypothetical protein
MLKTSTYNKIKEIIDAAAEHNGGVKELAESMQGKSESFVYYKKDAEGKTVEYPSDTSTIRKKIRFCIDLGLLVSEKNCTLTNNGKNARETSRFDPQLKLAVLEYLESNGLPWNKLESAINRITFPSFQALYKMLSPKIPEDTFRTCLYLLIICDAENRQNILKPFQMKLYLTKARLEKEEQNELAS